MKINCRECDICKDYLGSRDFQYWLRKPIIKWGAPALAMKRMDICSDCMAKLMVLIEHPELMQKGFE